MNGRVKPAANKGIRKLRKLQGNVKDRERKNLNENAKKETEIPQGKKPKNIAKNKKGVRI